MILSLAAAHRGAGPLPERKHVTGNQFYNMNSCHERYVHVVHIKATENYKHGILAA